jgi:FtsP/CotA-like multicopper oxidase with cupredoxin domain
MGPAESVFPTRREFLRSAAVAIAGGYSQKHLPFLQKEVPRDKADFQLRIEPCTLNIGRGVEVKTVAYNGQVPGPLLQLKQGKPITIDVTNATPNEDLVHWHGLTTETSYDGAVEEGSPLIPPGATLRYHLTPQPSGTRWYHTHAMAMDDLSRGTYSGQFGFLLVDGALARGDHDKEVNLAIHHWGAHFVPMVETMRRTSQNVPQTSGSDVGYTQATINAHMLGEGEPVRVREGERVLFRLLNASATENVMLALPGHKFQVIAMDGNPVPHPQTVEVLSLAVAERVDAIVEMNAPGVWVLGSTLKESRDIGLGIIVEYAKHTGEAVWRDPQPMEWDYTQFASDALVMQPEEIFTLTFRDAGALNGSRFDTWTINGDAWPKIKPMQVKQGKRYRMVFRNATGDQHPMHLHRHNFEVTQIGDRRLSRLMKDTINVMPLQTVAVDFTADNPGDSLMHCHQQLHMDYGFMQMVKYIG